MEEYKYVTPDLIQVLKHELADFENARQGVLGRKKYCEDMYAKDPSSENKAALEQANKLMKDMEGHLANMQERLAATANAQMVIAPKKQLLKWLKKGKVPKVLLHLFAYWKEDSEEHTKLQFIENRYNDWKGDSEEEMPKPEKDDELYNAMKVALEKLIPEDTRPE